MVSAANYRSRGSRQRSWMPGRAKPDRRGKIQEDGWRLRRSGHANFPCHGGDAAGGRQCRLPVLFNRLSRHKQVLCYFPCTPRAAALRQARVSGGNLQNCAPSAACGGAMTQESNVPLVSSLLPHFIVKLPLADIDNPRDIGYAIYVTKMLNFVIIANTLKRKE